MRVCVNGLYRNATSEEEARILSEPTIENETEEELIARILKLQEELNAAIEQLKLTRE